MTRSFSSGLYDEKMSEIGKFNRWYLLIRRVRQTFYSNKTMNKQFLGYHPGHSRIEPGRLIKLGFITNAIQLNSTKYL